MTVRAPSRVPPQNAASALSAAAGMVDPSGVVSVYVNARDASIPGNSAVHEVEVTLDRLRREYRHEASRDGLARLRDMRQRVASVVLSGGAHNIAGFMTLAGGELVLTEPPGDVPTCWRVGHRPDLRPLIAALQIERPAGVVLVSGKSVRLFAWRPQRLAELWSAPFPDLEQSELVGPAHAHPRGVPGAAPSFTVGQQRDLYERRMADERKRFVSASSLEIGLRATREGWKELVVGGDNSELVSALAEALPAPTHLTVTTLTGYASWKTPGELEIDVHSVLAEQRERVAVQRVRDLVQDPASKGGAAFGAAEVLEALEGGRVRTLFLAGSNPVARSRHTDAEADELADAMIAPALATGAELVAIPCDAVELPDGVGALLRW